jgi:hypothetical protein
MLTAAKRTTPSRLVMEKPKRDMGVSRPVPQWAATALDYLAPGATIGVPVKTAES